MTGKNNVMIDIDKLVEEETGSREFKLRGKTFTIPDFSFLVALKLAQKQQGLVQLLDEIQSSEKVERLIKFEKLFSSFRDIAQIGFPTEFSDDEIEKNGYTLRELQCVTAILLGLDPALFIKQASKVKDEQDTVDDSKNVEAVGEK